MKSTVHLFLYIFILISSVAQRATSQETLGEQLRQVIQGKAATVGVAVQQYVPLSDDEHI